MFKNLKKAAVTAGLKAMTAVVTQTVRCTPAAPPLALGCPPHPTPP